MNISILAAGARGMYCGSCMRDNALAAALKRAGHAVTLIPLYTPLRTDSPGAAIPEVYYGGERGPSVLSPTRLAACFVIRRGCSMRFSTGPGC